MLQDIRFALRTLGRTPGFAITAVLTLGVGLGLNTMLFTLFNAYVLRPVSVSDPYSLYQLSYTSKSSGTGTFSWPQYAAIRSEAAVFADTIAMRQFSARVEEQTLDGLLVSGNYFAMLGVRTVLGRPILAEDAATPGAGAVAVLSNDFWRRQFGSDRGVVGRKMLVNQHPVLIIGVCPPGFTGLSVEEAPAEFYMPVTMENVLTPGLDLFGADKPAMLQIVGRLAPGVSSKRAQTVLTAVGRRLADAFPDAERSQATLTSRATVLPWNDRTTAAFSPLVMAFGLVLVISCANVMNMMLGRALARRKEIGVRLALGARRGRLMRQLLAENVLLAALAGATGLVVSYFGIREAERLVVTTLPESFAKIVHLEQLPVDLRVMGFLFLAAALTTIASGLAPALQATQVNLVNALRGEFEGRMRQSRLRHALVASQMTVCLLLAVLTGLLVRNSAHFQQTDVGFPFHRIVTAFLTGTENTGTVKLAQRLAAEPWVESVAAVMRPPLSGTARSVTMTPAGGKGAIVTKYNRVSPEYFGMLDLAIVRGRNFAAEEARAEAAVVIVSQATAGRFWPGENPLGKTLDVGQLRRYSPEQPRMGRSVVIGVTKDVVSGMLFQGTDATMVYFPTAVTAARSNPVLVRAGIDGRAARERLEASLETAIPDQGAFALSMEDAFAVQVYPFRAASLIGFLLGLVALMLTASGMYGVMSYLVGQRTKEIGVRMALGATRGSVIELVFRQSGRLAVVGIGVGIALAIGMSKLMGTIFFLPQPYDAVAYGCGLGVVVLAGAAATYVPSRRAAQIDPMEILRAE